MVKAAAGLAESSAPAAEPLTSAHLRTDPASSPSISLVAIRDITNVNALAAGPITFAPDGLTVVYGDNASGKSGIARILKKAGRSAVLVARSAPVYLSPTQACPRARR